MGAAAGPKIATDGLVLCLDAENTEDSFAIKNENLVPSSALAVTIEGTTGYVVSTDTTVANPFGAFDGVVKFQVTNPNTGSWRRGINYLLIAGNTYTISFYIKNGTFANLFTANSPSYVGSLAVTFSPSFQVVYGGLTQTDPVGDGWYRQTLTFTPTYTQTYRIGFTFGVSSINPAGATGSLYLYGFQLERGSTASEYTPTTGTAIDKYASIKDITLNGNDATAVNGVGYNTVEKSFVFDGVNDYTDISATTNVFSADFSISCWFLTNSITNSYRVIFETNGYRQGTGGFSIYNYGSQLQIWKNDAGISTLMISGGVLQTGIFNNFTLTRNSGQLYLYLNNNFINSYSDGSQDYYQQNITSKYNFGGGRTIYFFNGKLTTLNIYNRALSADEIKQNFNALRGRYGV